MAFKHFKSVVGSGAMASLHTVPAGKEFVWLRARARGAGTATFMVDDTTLCEVTIPSGAQAGVSDPLKTVVPAGGVLRAIGGAGIGMYEAIGLEFKAGTWETVKDPTAGGSSSSSSSSEESSNSAESSSAVAAYDFEVSGATNLADANGFYTKNGDYYYNSNGHAYLQFLGMETRITITGYDYTAWYTLSSAMTLDAIVGEHSWNGVAGGDYLGSEVLTVTLP